MKQMKLFTGNFYILYTVLYCHKTKVHVFCYIPELYTFSPLAELSSRPDVALLWNFIPLPLAFLQDLDPSLYDIIQHVIYWLINCATLRLLEGLEFFQSWILIALYRVYM
ncbi:hypothetical protein XELAEV_18045911mg [Xenopus laevis]|uniref:Uncharacterized protein n=1 Tax=Xenopus laevis TaxID=8355 RepID=A0A974BSK4_XENLA|nr:hypothetical protein XELAEV_18045911mg [Xenopus laevis]